MIKAMHTTEQDHFDTSRKIKKNLDNLGDQLGNKEIKS